jgi:hypothetical protein
MASLDNNWPPEFGLPSHIAVKRISGSIARAGKVADQASSRLFHPYKGDATFPFTRDTFYIFHGFFMAHMAMGSRPAIISLNLDGASRQYFMYFHKGFVVTPDFSHTRWSVKAKIYLEEIL